MLGTCISFLGISRHGLCLRCCSLTLTVDGMGCCKRPLYTSNLGSRLRNSFPETRVYPYIRCLGLSVSCHLQTVCYVSDVAIPVNCVIEERSWKTSVCPWELVSKRNKLIPASFLIIQQDPKAIVKQCFDTLVTGSAYCFWCLDLTLRIPK